MNAATRAAITAETAKLPVVDENGHTIDPATRPVWTIDKATGLPVKKEKKNP